MVADKIFADEIEDINVGVDGAGCGGICQYRMHQRG